MHGCSRITNALTWVEKENNYGATTIEKLIRTWKHLVNNQRLTSDRIPEGIKKKYIQIELETEMALVNKG
jgi:tyrosine-protein phosphatase YwqE